MVDEGPGSTELGPSAVPEVERLRRRLYGPGGPTEAERTRYEELLAAPAALDTESSDPSSVPRDASQATDQGRTDDRRASARSAASRLRTHRRTRVLVPLVGVTAVGCAAVAVLLNQLGPHPLPERVPLPSPEGTTILGYSRPSNPATAPNGSTIEPADYTIYDPRGRRVRVILRCVGAGHVRIYAGGYFDFRCTDNESVQRRTSIGARHARFTIYGHTIGNVVWGLRVVLV